MRVPLDVDHEFVITAEPAVGQRQAAIFFQVDESWPNKPPVL
ncbi:hypothetical protein L831_4963 [Mycobacteroides abscessus MAB_082312_2272]|nr:hypothetical protein L831_4963 [Mycobacteroides abscessus MAB_082312_2272]